MNLRRREFARVAAAAATTLWLPRSSWGQTAVRSQPFTLGVASGSPRADSVVLWTRLLPRGLFASLGDSPVTVRWELAHDDLFKQIVQQGQAQAVPELAHSVHAEVAGLQPDRWYFYRFHAGDFSSPVGRTRTLPAPDAAVSRLRLAYASCQRWEHGHFAAWRHLVADQPDLVLFLGDYIYEYPGAAQAVRSISGGWTQSLDSYRDRYAQYKSDEQLQGAHAACPWAVTWDDHEVQNDYTGHTEGYSGATETALSGSFAQRRAAAYQAWYEHMPVRSSVLQDNRIHLGLPWGRLANLLLLDPRQHKSPLVCTRDGRPGSSTVDVKQCAALADPARSMLGSAQEAWMAQQLDRSSATWQVLGQGSLLGPRNFRGAGHPMIWNDGWDGYPAARDRFTAMLARNQAAKSGASHIVLGGDVHENWVGQVKASYAQTGSPVVGAEFCGTSITSRSNNQPRSTVDNWLAQNPHFQFADNVKKGYGLCDFTPGKLTTQLRVLDDPTRQDASISTLATFEVKAGNTHVQPV